MSIGPHRPDLSLALDTDVLTDWLYRKQSTRNAIANYLAELKVLPAIPSHAIFEVLHGFEKVLVNGTGDQENTLAARHRANELITDCTVLDFNRDAAEIAAYIWRRLSQSQRNRHWTDILIAATVMAHDHGIATRNRTDFELINDVASTKYSPLRIQVWKSN